jgi:hypothetical protein
VNKHSDEWEEVEVDRVMHTTAKAILCRIDGVEYWIPKSQIYRVDDFKRGYSGTIEIAAWWLEANDLEHLAETRSSETAWQVPANLEKSHQIYRRLAAKYHPDRSPETVETMKDINELWQSILDAMKKR